MGLPLVELLPPSVRHGVPHCLLQTPLQSFVRLVFGTREVSACLEAQDPVLFQWFVPFLYLAPLAFAVLNPNLAIWRPPLCADLYCFSLSLSEPVEVTWLDAVNALVCLGLASWYMLTKHWIANNVIAIAFAIQGIALVSVGSYKIGCGLLSGLFFYDIFWVFGTDVMVTVAKSFDGPIKVVWPKDLMAATYSFSMLGLGDIVIPGLFLALLLRYDVKRSKNKKHFSAPYFNTTFVGYILGLAITMFVMHVFRAAQPALLYLVPACILTSAVTGLVLGDFSGLLNYSEASSEDKNKEKKE